MAEDFKYNLTACWNICCISIRKFTGFPNRVLAAVYNLGCIVGGFLPVLIIEINSAQESLNSINAYRCSCIISACTYIIRINKLFGIFEILNNLSINLIDSVARRLFVNCLNSGDYRNAKLVASLDGGMSKGAHNVEVSKSPKEEHLRFNIVFICVFCFYIVNCSQNLIGCENNIITERPHSAGRVRGEVNRIIVGIAS